jgi:hypothetical protein
MCREAILQYVDIDAAAEFEERLARARDEFRTIVQRHIR